MKNDLRSYRAQQLLLKDMDDVEIDLRDDDITPLIKILGSFPPREAENILEETYRSFEYSDFGRENYPEVLNSLDFDSAIEKDRIREVEESLEGSVYRSL